MFRLGSQPPPRSRKKRTRPCRCWSWATRWGPWSPLSRPGPARTTPWSPLASRSLPSQVSMMLPPCP